MAALAFRIVDYGYILERGRVVMDGDSEYLKSKLDSREVSAAYLS